MGNVNVICHLWVQNLDEVASELNGLIGTRVGENAGLSVQDILHFQIVPSEKDIFAEDYDRQWPGYEVFALCKTQQLEQLVV